MLNELQTEQPPVPSSADVQTPRAKIVAIANQKGGVGKTTTSVNLASSVALAGVKTILLDLDSQANVTSGLGFPKADLDSNIYAAVMGDKPLNDILLQTEIPALRLAPSGIDLVGLELELAGVENREFRLKNAIEPVRSQAQFIFLDCPPSLGLTTVNALTAADSVLVPIQCEYYALEGLSQLMRTIDVVRERFNRDLQVEGILFTMYDGRSNLTRQVREEVERHFYGKTFRTWIPRNIRLAEAPGFGKPGVVYDPQSVGSRAYKILADEFLQNNNIKSYEIEPNPQTSVTPVEVV